MERNQLRYVVEIARQENITRASEILHIAQPSLSNQLIHLENELGVKLFERTRKRIYLTQAGEIFVRKAEHILNEFDHLADIMKDFAKLRIGRLRIGALSTMIPLGIPHQISDFSAQHPTLDIYLTESGSSELVQKVKAGELDVAFILHTGEPDEEILTYRKLMESRFMAIVNKTHPLSSKESLKIDDLKDQKLIVTTSDFNLQRILLSRMDEREIPYKVSTQCNQIETCFILADQGMGISFCTEATTGYYHCKNVTYIPMKDFPVRSVFLVYKNDPAYHPALRCFVEHICGSNHPDKVIK